MITVRFTPPMGELFQKHAAKVPLVVRDSLTRLGVMGQSQMKRLTPVDTGRLRKSITWELAKSTEVHIGSNVTYAPFILTDVKPFTIKVKYKKALAWVDKGKIRPASISGWREASKRGVAHYAKEVKHPGGADVLNKTGQYLESKIPGVVLKVFAKYGIQE